jgi:hypothetical protein
VSVSFIPQKTVLFIPIVQKAQTPATCNSSHNARDQTHKTVGKFNVAFKALTAVAEKNTAFCDVMPRFGWTYRLRLQVRRVSQGRNQQKQVTHWASLA